MEYGRLNVGRLRGIWNNPKSLSVLSLSWMLLWFLVCRFFIWPAFSLDLAEGAVVFVLAGQIPAICRHPQGAPTRDRLAGNSVTNLPRQFVPRRKRFTDMEG
jgi:hypothetical protein